MNKTMKKLGLLIVAAVAMTMGVNSANALQIDSDAVNSDRVITDSTKGNISIDETNMTYYVVTLKSNATYNITAGNGEYVVINLNGYTLTGNIAGTATTASVTINGNGQVVGDINGAAITNLTINGGNYAYVGTFTPAATKTEINGIGTVLKAGMEGSNDANLNALYRSVPTNGYVVLAEAYAVMTGLTDVINNNTAPATVIANASTYTTASYNAWLNAYNAAKALIDANTKSRLLVSRQPEINAAATNLLNAYQGLKLLASYTGVDNAINFAKTTVANANAAGTVYTDASLKVLNNAIAYANANRGLDDSRQSEVDAMATAINDALGALVEKADYSKINDLESVIAGLKAEQYTTETWTILQYVRSTIERDLPKSQGTKVGNYYNQLLSAVKGLKRSANQTLNNGGTTNPGTTVNPGTTTNNGGSTNISGTVVNPNTNASGTTGVVDTGDNVATYAVMNIVSLIALAGCGLVLRKQN